MREATLDDIDELFELECEIFPENRFNETTIRTELGRGGAIVVDEFGNPGSLLGYLLYRTDADILDITRLGVRQFMRCAGIGTLLLRTAMTRVHQDPDLRRLMLTVRKKNEPALRLYLRHGFEVVGEASSEVLPPSWVMVTSDGL